MAQEYALSQNCPATVIPAGDKVVPAEAELKVDRGGVARPADKVSDAGAYQHQPR